MNRQAGRQTDRETQADRHRQIDRQRDTGRQADRHRQADRQIYSQIETETGVGGYIIHAWLVFRGHIGVKPVMHK